MDVLTADGGALEAYENYEYFSADENKPTRVVGEPPGDFRIRRIRRSVRVDSVRGDGAVRGSVRPEGGGVARGRGGDDALAAGIRAALAKEARGWRDAPRDLEEIRAMQAGEVGVWA